MAINRLEKYMKESEETDDLRGFVVNPFGPNVPAWQAQLYEAAFRRAQKEVEQQQDRPPADWCI